MAARALAWLRFFRIVNLPTVPGDVLVGAAAVVVAARRAALTASDGVALAEAAAASCCVYLYGLADNDIVGAPTDSGRPIPEGRISLRAASVARALCWAAALGFGAAAALPPLWWGVTLVTLLASAVYNRTKGAVVMGLCRGLNVLAGAAALPIVLTGARHLWPIAFALVWTLYIGFVTKYSEGEETDPARRCRVGFLIGALVYLQLASLVTLTLLSSSVRPLLLAGGVLLVLLRLAKRLVPTVSAS